MNSFFTEKILLASQSPRRQQLLRDSGFDLQIINIQVEEDFDPKLQAEQISEYLAEKKNLAYQNEIEENTLLVTADTIVWLHNEVLNKPANLAEAKLMLQRLSGYKHTVYTGVCVRSKDKKILFSEVSDVYFSSLSDEIIDYYLTHYSPLDKAGAYGIQEFIGYVAIKRIEGCYYNVMGFPVTRFIQEIAHFK